MKLLFAHGWGFDRHVWDPLTRLLSDRPQAIDDRGYFGAPHAPDIEGQCLAITHSFGTMRVLADPPPALVGIVAINGFERFTALPGKPGVAGRVVDRMLRRFGESPHEVLADFRRACGCDAPFGEIDPAPLHADLLRLRDARPPLPHVPVVVLNGGQDPILPPEMRGAVFSGCDVRRLEHEAAGHLLPIENPHLCAQAIRGALAALGEVWHE